MFAESSPTDATGLIFYVEVFGLGVMVLEASSRLDDHRGEMRPETCGLRASQVLDRLRAKGRTPLPPPVNEHPESDEDQG